MTALIIIAADARDRVRKNRAVARAPRSYAARCGDRRHALALQRRCRGVSPTGAGTGTARPATAGSNPRPRARRHADRVRGRRPRGDARRRDGCSRAMYSSRRATRTLKTRNAKYERAGAELQRRRGRRVRRSESEGERQLARTSTRPAAPRSKARSSSCKDRNARGAADRIQVTRDEQLKLDGVRYTTCPLGKEDWVLRACDIDIRQRAGLGIGRGVRLDFKGVPILYTPFISFPVGNQRKSGFLFPTLGTSSRSGYVAVGAVVLEHRAELRRDVHADLVLQARRQARQRVPLPDGPRPRHARLPSTCPTTSEFGDCAQLRALRRPLRLHRHAAARHRRGERRATAHWFEDFGLGPEGTSISYLNRSASLTYLDAALAGGAARAELPDDRRHRHRARAAAAHPAAAAGGARRLSRPAVRTCAFGLDMEVGNFDAQLRRPASRPGWRMDVAPEIRMPLRGAGIYLEPAASWRYTSYRLDDTGAPLADDSPQPRRADRERRRRPDLRAPVGLARAAPATLEPRFMYLYVPFRNQDDLPVFDTGAGRSQPGAAVSHQSLRRRRPARAMRTRSASASPRGCSTPTPASSSSPARSARRITSTSRASRCRAKCWTIPSSPTSSRSSTSPRSATGTSAWACSGIRARRARRKATCSCSTSRSSIGSSTSATASAAATSSRSTARSPGRSATTGAHTRAWCTRSRTSTSLDQFAGLEYRSCCWRIRAVARRYVSDRTGDIDTSFLLQLELNGLSSVGVGADAFLERSIRGYSAGPPEP